MIAKHENKIVINIEKNIRFCFNAGFGALRTAEKEMDYRNALVLLHNGVELLMKLFLKSKDRNLIYANIDKYNLLYERTDLIKTVDDNKVKQKILKTITFNECVELISHFIKTPEIDLKKLDSIRNNCVHNEAVLYKNEIRMILIVNIYPFIKELICELKLDLDDFIDKIIISSLDKQKQFFDDSMRNSLNIKIEKAKMHYFEELNEFERNEKLRYQDYKIFNHDKLIKCPACSNDALLRIHLRTTNDEYSEYKIIKKNLILKELTCHHCGLNIDERVLLLLDYADEEKTISEKTIYYDCPNDCPDEYDCPDDCPEEYDCPDDCPDEFDCPDDCPEEYDCPDDCPEEYDCPDDCPDCPH